MRPFWRASRRTSAGCGGWGWRAPREMNRHLSRKRPMIPKKTLQQRQKELQSLLATPAGRDELAELESRYSAAGGGWRLEGASLVTYILVYERERGLIVL